MKNRILLIVTLLLLTACSQSEPSYVQVTNKPVSSMSVDELRSQYTTTMDYAGEAWFDQHEVYSVNEMNHRANFYYYDNEDSAISALESALDNDDHKIQSNYQSLNGDWYFKYVPNPSQRLRTLISSNITDYTEEWDITSFDEVVVPMTLQTQRNDDGSFKYESPIYMNNTYPWLNTESIQYGWDGNVVAATSFNSVSHYKRYFNVDKDHLYDTALLHVQGISSAYYVYINGQCVGYSEDSYTDSYFDVSPYLIEGENSIAFEVYRYCDGSYLENQDMIRLSGIFRDVSIEYTDKTYIYDVVTKANYEDGVDLSIDVTINSETSLTIPLKVSLVDASGTIVNSKSLFVDVVTGSSLHTITMNDLNVQRWNIDDPHLYRLIINLNDSCISGLRIGFRELEWDESAIYINGIKTELKGVNRHEMDPVTGKVLSKDTIIQELTLIKDSNINAIRLSHYPNNNLTYDVADELGLLLIDEANIESHGGEVELHIPGNNPIFIDEMKDRFTSMVARDRNHASVIIYSYGNESTYSTYPMDDNYGFYVLSQLALELDDTRLRMYERDNRYGETREESMVDIASSQYYSINQMKDNAKEFKIPYLQQEYAHAMGNALGNFKEYHDAIIESECAGGFVWDFKDQSILTMIDGVQVYGNGYDWNTPLTDGSFCGNGIVFANGKPQPELYDLKQVYQNVEIRYLNQNLVIKNNYPTKNLNEFVFQIVLLDDGDIVFNKDIKLDCLAGSQVEVPLTLPDTNGHRVLQVRMFNTNTNRNSWIAYQQFELTTFNRQLDAIKGSNALTVVESDDSIVVSNKEKSNTVVIDKKSASIESIVVNGQQLVNGAHELLLYRAPLDNDPALNVNVLQPSYSGKVVIKSISNKNDLVTVQLAKKLDNLDVSYDVTYTINSDACVDVKTSVKLGKFAMNGPVSIIGFQTLVNEAYTNVSYYGNGEGDNYIDRNNSAAYGIYSQDIRDNNDYFLTPTTRNHKLDVHWLSIQNENESSINIEFDKPISFTYTNPTNYLLATSSHDECIEHQDSNALVIEAKHLGVGNGSYGPYALEQYMIDENSTYDLHYQLNFK